MRALIQRVQKAKVTVDNNTVGSISHGVLVFLGITHSDSKNDVDWLVEKILKLRIFTYKEGKLNESIKDINGEILVVSQFTLYGNAKKGTRPSFTNAAKGDIARPLYEYMVERLKKADVKVETGVFGAYMQVSLVNDGPVTLLLEKETQE
ncbi:MAG: D-tyrosyl-tRNA(Tyr) deacylase [Candidatus Magasanikbacteria bacterium]|jgi:D-aminoacyl-tRNA deacylase|nr:D-tyrosyl-tRNA(Tyr) deacylase [Candidatus Magasanikbacteria bacterium]MBT4221151.1 D-tyrosyl-tRNA(Tyr) deacylase [Candidatus Magasanikbacteria bacterium]MBT4350279.1 D-tyrosyl-tRNA(Tyr) deacylase [Candidatus Magasanikbacteria bacterium]MBT4541705.1 D-tyrosyl-tRNA(Tyr) deacylase [Candidatus Magasanikbacteria bacterium]MBT6253318.1 D-tyrosyl-tRNA(Tyr) deacylase [Candidatus Magasanikbacteria bacterium]